MRFMRIMIGVHSVNPWTQEQREQVHAEIEKAVLGARRHGALTQPGWSETGQSITGVDCHLMLFPPPTEGGVAFRQGFWRRENPFEKETESHDAWNIAYDNEPRRRDYDRSFQSLRDGYVRDDR